MKVEGPRKKLRKAIVLNFPDRGELETILDDGSPSRNFLAIVTADADYERQVAQLIRRADKEGWIGELVEALLAARRGKAPFVAAVQPIADQIKKTGGLPPDEAPEGRIPLPSAGIWIGFSLAIAGAALASKVFSGELPLGLVPALILATLFFALGIATLVAPRHPLLIDLYATDQSLIMGFGASGLLLSLALAASAFFSVSAAWPWINDSIARLPRADKKAPLSVLIARLEGDDWNGSQTERVKASLEHALIPNTVGPNIQLLETGKSLRRGVSPDVYKQREIAKSKGREWLLQSGADILVWGYVVGSHNQIFFLLSEGAIARQPKESYSDPGLYLPKDFNEDLGDAIAARMIAAAIPAIETGHFVDDLLEDIYNRMTILASHQILANSQVICEVRLALGNITNRLGDQRHDNNKLQEAVTLYKQILSSRRCTEDRDFVAAVQNSLGIALTAAGEQELETILLTRAVTAYNEALKQWTRSRVPFKWAMVQNNLGNALIALGKQAQKTSPLKNAVTAFNEALMEWTRARAPLEWATLQYNLGNALTAMGEQEQEVSRLKEAIAHYDGALQEFTRERVPLNWARCKSNIGSALKDLATQENNLVWLQQAVDAFQEALKELTHERAPFEWATTQNNLGNAFGDLGERRGSASELRQAVEAYGKTLTVWTRERVPWDWALTQNNLGTVLVAFGKLENNPARVKQGLEAYNEALKEFSRERTPLEWAGLHRNLALALIALGEHENDATQFDAAHAALREMAATSKAILVFDPSNSQWQTVLRTSAVGMGRLANKFIFARDFGKSLEAADEAISLEPDLVLLYTHRAHALMFLQREDEARGLYLLYRGTKNVLDAKSWETVILDDFAALTKAGLSQSLMEEIKQQFSAPG